ncbi:MAG: hypothetical protein NC203_07780 [Firmicutes bacterium]|nr:hypothetical protein [[Eubacterium] siraeum]MCM1488249.1 hypothetical protein [Bacillota bacterium]
MSASEKKGITVKIDANLHAEVRAYLESHEMTMAEFVTLALRDELHPQLNMAEVRNMGNMRTLAFQVPEELFRKIKDYLQRNNMSQKEFVIGLIEKEIDRDLTQRALNATMISEESAEDLAEIQGNIPVNDYENISDEVEGQFKEREKSELSEDFEDENEETEDINEVDEPIEAEEDMVMGMGM